MVTASDSTRLSERLKMVSDQLRSRGIHHGEVLRAMSEVPRHEFVPEAYSSEAYQDRPLPIGHGQTISQPYMVASMIEALEPSPDDCVLEVGTGSGYQAAVLEKIVSHVATFEWIPELADIAKTTLKRLGSTRVKVFAGDGSLGNVNGLFDGIIVAAGAGTIPPKLLDKLSPTGRLVIPLGAPTRQTLTVVSCASGKIREEKYEDCVFVPLLGPHGWNSRAS